MLTQTSINAAAPLAALLADKGIALIPKAGTPLAALVMSSRYMLDVGVAMESLPDPAGQTMTEYAAALQASSAEPHADGAQEHDILMETVVNNLRTAVSFTQNLARNTITPMVDTVVKDLEGSLDSAAATGLHPLNIVSRDYSNFAHPAIVQDLAGQYGEILADQLPLTLRIPMPANIADYLLTGQDGIDGAVASYVESIGAEGVKSLWDRLFGGEASILTQVANEHKPETYGDAALAMIIVRNLQQNAPAGLNMPLEDLNSYLLTMQQQLGRILFNIPKQIDADVASGRLVIRAPRGVDGRGDVIVNGPLYQQYLSKGGTPEAIFGALSDGNAPGLAELLEKQDTYTRSWGRAKEQLVNQEVEGRFGTMKGAISRAVGRLIAELPEDQLVTSREVLHQRLTEQLEALRGPDMEDRYGMVRRVICRAVFPHTQAEELLCLIDASAKADGDVSEAVLTATTNYIVAWGASQFDRVSV